MPIDALSVSYVQLTRDLLAIAKFLFLVRNWFSLKNIIISGHLSITLIKATYLTTIDVLK